MANLPSGTITFLYTDIEGSTRLWEQYPLAMKHVLARHNAIIRFSTEMNGGQVFRIVGDGFCTAFLTAQQALKAAIDAQRALCKEKWEIDTPIRVRMALHTGEAEFHESDYVGASLNHIGRLLSAGHGGQILLTLATEVLVHDHLPEGISLCALGQHQFRDLSQPESIFQVEIPELQHEFPPLKSLHSSLTNLSIPITSFIGRTKELAEVKSLLIRNRMVTLTGPGGIGKTRLALQSGMEVLDMFPDGVWLVELASLADPDLIEKNIANVLHIHEQPNLSLQLFLTEMLRSKEVLILLDTCEHLIERCAIITNDFLNTCPHLHIMVTSREPLDIPGEMVYRVPSLSIPPKQDNTSTEEIGYSESVHLFIERATAVNSLFRITTQNASSIAQICQRLDGIPLAIELAAARTKLLSVEQIAARLDDRFRLLTGGSRTAMPRQKTLRAMIDWSYDLLSAPERDLLRQLSIFTGGWTFDAAEAICLIEDGNILDTLEQLVNKSLVIPEAQNREVRYRMLETILEYAQEKLFETDEVEYLRDRHLEYFLNLSKELSLQHNGLEQNIWLNKLESELDNFRSALNWGIDRNILLATQIACNLTFLWRGRGYGSEADRWFKAMLQKLSDTKEIISEDDFQLNRARLLSSQAFILYGLGKYQRGDLILQESVHLFRQIKDNEHLIFPLSLLGVICVLTAKYAEAGQYAEECIALSRAMGDTFGLGLGLGIMGQVELYTEEGNLIQAQNYLEASTDRLRETGNEWLANSFMIYIALGVLYIKQGNFAASRNIIQESMAFSQSIGDRQYTNVARSQLAANMKLEGDLSNAIRLYKETLSEWSRLGNHGGAARCLECIGFILIDQLQGFHPEQFLEKLTECAQLLGAAESIRFTYSAPMIPDEKEEYNQYIHKLNQIGDGTIITRAWKEGKKMTFDQAVSFGLNSQYAAQ